MRKFLFYFYRLVIEHFCGALSRDATLMKMITRYIHACGDAAMGYPNDPTHSLHLVRAGMDIRFCCYTNVVHIFSASAQVPKNTEILSHFEDSIILLELVRPIFRRVPKVQQNLNGEMYQMEPYFV